MKKTPPLTIIYEKVDKPGRAKEAVLKPFFYVCKIKVNSLSF